MKVAVITDTAITGADSNYYTLGFKNKGAAGSGTAVIASKDFTAGIDTTAYDEYSLGALSNNKLNEGDVVTFYKAATNSGANMPALTAIIFYVRD